MTPADWLIVLVIVLNVILARHARVLSLRALSMAGLVVGYVVAAWQYQRLAGWLLTFLEFGVAG